MSGPPYKGPFDPAVIRERVEAAARTADPGEEYQQWLRDHGWVRTADPGGLDVERLAQAIAAEHGTFCDGDHAVEAELIALEYARLAPSPTAPERTGLDEAARAVMAAAEPDDDHDGQFVDYIVPAPAIEALRAALASQEPGS